MRLFKNAFTSDPIKIESAFYVLLIPSTATIPCLVLFTVLTCQIADCVGSSHSRLQEPLNSKHDMQMKLPALLRFMWIISASTQLKYVYIKRMIEQLQLGIPKLLGNCLPAMLTLFDPPTSFHMMLMLKNQN